MKMHSIHFSPIYRVHSKIGFLTQGIRRLLFQMDLGGGIIYFKSIYSTDSRYIKSSRRHRCEGTQERWIECGYILARAHPYGDPLWWCFWPYISSETWQVFWNP